jgi:hypothetical protein
MKTCQRFCGVSDFPFIKVCPLGHGVSNSNSNQPDQIVVVVHGVGDPQPGQTLSLLSRSMADPQRPFVESPNTIWLREKSDETCHIRSFPVQQTQVTFEDQKIELCEAFWGDLSRVSHGWLGVLRGIFQIIFGMRYVAYVAADQPGKPAYWLKTLGLMSARILQGPVLAVTVFLGLLIAAVCGTHLVWKQSHTYANWPQITIMAVGAFAFLASEIGSRITRSRVVERFWYWINATIVFVVGVMLVRLFWLDQNYPLIAHTCEVHPGVMWYCRVLVELLGLLWFIEIQVILAMAVCWLLAARNKKSKTPALTLAFLLPALAVGFWGQSIPMSWLAIKESIGEFASLHDFSKVFDDAIPFLGIQMIMVLVLVVTLGTVLIRYALWRNREPEFAFESGRKAPRLLVHPSLQMMLTVCTGLGVVLVSSLWLSNTFGGSPSDEKTAMASFLEIVNGYTISILVPLGGLFVFFLPHLRPGFDMILDVVNHFYFRPTHVSDVLDDDDEFDIAETTFENGQLFFSRREALHDRLRRILSHYRDQYTHQPELVIVSHSQGTMVAIETLNEKDLVWLNNAFSSVTLVTMGSPFSHLYQHYFGHFYPSLDSPFWASLRGRVDRWVNLFRVDDYVGNEIDFPDTFGDQTGEAIGVYQPPTTGTQTYVSEMQCKNIAVGARGHVSYWTDREILDHLRRELYWSHDQAQPRRSA